MHNPDWLTIVPQRIFHGMNGFVFLAIPFFILAGKIMAEVGITDRILRFTNALVGHVRGGLAQVNILSSMLFAGISGAALSDVSALGSVFIPAMKRSGYDGRFAAAITATSSIQGAIIPPSIIIVLYGAITRSFVGALFAAGIIPEILIGLTGCLLVALRGKSRGYPRKSGPFSLQELGKSFLHSIPALILPIIILGGILAGVVTPTEAAAVAVLYGLLVGTLLMRGISFRLLLRVAQRTVLKSSSLFIIVAFANIFSWVLAMENVPTLIGEAIFGWTDNLYLIFLVINVILLFVGTWLETSAAIILLAPIFAPAMTELGLHPIHIGMIMIVNLVIGLVTPPFGIVLYATSAISGYEIEEISREAFPYLLLDILVLFLVTSVPEVSLYFPRRFGLI